MHSHIHTCPECRHQFTPETLRGHQKTEKGGAVRCLTAAELPYRKNYQQNRDGVWIALTGSRCNCAECGEFFSSERLFSQHRAGAYAKGEEPNTRRCMSAEEMAGKGWRINSRGLWTEASV
jgi:hypothetical protein